MKDHTDGVKCTDGVLSKPSPGPRQLKKSEGEIAQLQETLEEPGFNCQLDTTSNYLQDTLKGIVYIGLDCGRASGKQSQVNCYGEHHCLGLGSELCENRATERSSAKHSSVDALGQLPQALATGIPLCGEGLT